MGLRLVSEDGRVQLALRPGVALTLGRALSCDLPVLDPTISRQHAELVVLGEELTVRDLASSNGTFVDGRRVRMARLVAGGRLAFGTVGFTVQRHVAEAVEARRRTARAGTTIVRAVPAPTGEDALDRALRATGERRAIPDAAPADAAERDRARLALLLEVSKALTRIGDADVLLERLATYAIRALDASRVVVWVAQGDALVPVPAVVRGGRGAPAPERAPDPAMAQEALLDTVAVLSGDGVPAAGERVACAPLVARDERAVGVLEVAAPSAAMREEDLDLLVGLAGIAAAALDNIRAAERARADARIRDTFERFFPPALAARIAEAPGALGSTGERRTVAVLFADVRGFTALAQRLPPDAVARLLNEYLSEAVECVFRHGGTLDKFIGDAVMAQWGAPLAAGDDADRALDAAQDLLRSVDALNARWRAEGRPEIAVGVGLGHGEAFAGFLGSERRLEYTVIGETVNLASRICDQAAGGEILLAAPMAAACTRSHALAPRTLPPRFPGDVPVDAFVLAR